MKPIDCSVTTVPFDTVRPAIVWLVTPVTVSGPPLLNTRTSSVAGEVRGGDQFEATVQSFVAPPGTQV